MQASPQWVKGRFSNGLSERVDLPQVLRNFLKRSKHRFPELPVPLAPSDAGRFAALPASGLRLTWLGHSSTLVEIDGVVLLLDPVWGPRSSPSPHLGPRRFFEPPWALQDLPRPHAVLISHDHYDHLDEPTIRAMRDWDTRFVVPLGVGAHLELWGVPASRIVELDWWQELALKGITLVCTPSRHFSGRGIFNRNSTLWSGWAMIGPRHRVYYSGDGAMTGHFSELGKRYGPFDASLMEAGAYDPAWSDLHGGPEQAVEAWKALRGGLLLPVHWGTFNLAFHTWTEPVERMIVAAAAAGARMFVPQPGESVEPATAPPLRRWWPDLPWRTAQESPMVSGDQGLA